MIVIMTPRPHEFDEFRVVGDALQIKIAGQDITSLDIKQIHRIDWLDEHQLAIQTNQPAGNAVVRQQHFELEALVKSLLAANPSIVVNEVNKQEATNSTETKALFVLLGLIFVGFIVYAMVRFA